MAILSISKVATYGFNQHMKKTNPELSESERELVSNIIAGSKSTGDIQSKLRTCIQ